MLMTTAKLVMLRIYSITLGRLPFFSRLLRLILLKLLIKGPQAKQSPYVASSRFFDLGELGKLESRQG